MLKVSLLTLSEATVCAWLGSMVEPPGIGVAAVDAVDAQDTSVCKGVSTPHG